MWERPVRAGRDGCVWQFHLRDAGRAQGAAAVTVSPSWSRTTISAVSDWLLRPALADDGGTTGIGVGRSLGPVRDRPWFWSRETPNIVTLAA